jgi:hypothetical protein
MARTTPLTAQERIILFCTATGISHAAVGITAHAMQSMTIKGFIVHNRESGTYALTDSGRATLRGILLDAGLSPRCHWRGPPSASNASPLTLIAPTLDFSSPGLSNGLGAGKKYRGICTLTH